jgi:subtilisin
MESAETRRYILLPTRGFVANEIATSDAVVSIMNALPSAAGTPSGPLMVPDTESGHTVAVGTVLDSIGPDGPKLIAATSEELRALHSLAPGVRVVKEQFYEPAVVRGVKLAATAAAAGLVRDLTVTVLDAATRKPIRGVEVLAFTDYKLGVGSSGRTLSNGNAKIRLPVGTALERVIAYPPHTHWSKLIRPVPAGLSVVIELDAIDLKFTTQIDALRHFYGNSGTGDGTGVVVGVIDTGVDVGHPDLQVAGGRNTVTGEKAADFGPASDHGTHVAGIIAARGTLRGVAPGTTIRSYRVFGKGARGAANFAIAKAIEFAVADGCHILNLSLGGGTEDDAIKSAMLRAFSLGTVCIAAAGNDHRQPVSFPATFTQALGVSALGRKRTYPRTSAASLYEERPFGSDKLEYIAAFSNFGPQIDFTGPGVDIISTVPKGRYAAMSGTSMACPAVTGCAARLLSSREDILGMSTVQARAEAIAKTLAAAAQRRGFVSQDFEGYGMLP